MLLLRKVQFLRKIGDKSGIYGRRNGCWNVNVRYVVCSREVKRSQAYLKSPERDATMPLTEPSDDVGKLFCCRVNLSGLKQMKPNFLKYAYVYRENELV